MDLNNLTNKWWIKITQSKAMILSMADSLILKNLKSLKDKICNGSPINSSEEWIPNKKEIATYGNNLRTTTEIMFTCNSKIEMASIKFLLNSKL